MWYLTAPDTAGRTGAELLAEYLGELRSGELPVGLPTGVEVVYERMAPVLREPVRWRTHGVRDRPLLDERAIAAASVVHTDFADGPQLDIELTKAGAAKFATVTRAHVGHKLVIAIDGEVIAAPVVYEPITGGRMMLSLESGGSPQQAQRDAGELAQVLAGGTLPAPVTWMAVAERPPTVSAADLRGARWIFGALLAVVVALVIGLGQAVTLRGRYG